MTVRTVKTTYEESNRIADDKQTFIFRSIKDGWKPNDIFNFQCYKDGRPVTHRNNHHGYIATMVLDHTIAPIDEGFVLVNFRRLK